MTIIHVEPEEFVRGLNGRQASLRCHAIALDNHMAAVIYFYIHDNCVWYMDRAMVSGHHQKELESRSFQMLHADIYRKMALDMNVCTFG